MTSYNGKNKALQANIPQYKIPEGEYNSCPRVVYDELVLTADLAANDIIPMALDIPAGARITSAKIISPDLGGTATLDLGSPSTTATGLIAAADVSGQACLATPAAGAADLGVLQAAPLSYQLHVNGASSGAVGRKIQVWIDYLLV